MALFPAPLRRFVAAMNAGIMIVSCGQQDTLDSSPTQIIGEDDRKSDDSYFERGLVGALAINGDKLCTAFASGPQTIITAYHCVAGKTEDIASAKATFITKEGESKILSVSSIEKKADFVELAVENPNSTWFEKGELDPTQTIFVVSMNSRWDGTLHNSAPRAGDEFGGGFFKHVMDTVPGASGSPIIQDGAYVGVHLGYQNLINIGVDVNKLSNIVFNNDKTEIQDENAIAVAIVAAIAGAVASQYTDYILSEQGRKERQQYADILYKKNLRPNDYKEHADDPNAMTITKERGDGLKIKIEAKKGPSGRYETTGKITASPGLPKDDCLKMVSAALKEALELGIVSNADKAFGSMLKACSGGKESSCPFAKGNGDSSSQGQSGDGGLQHHGSHWSGPSPTDPGSKSPNGNASGSTAGPNGEESASISSLYDYSYLAEIAWTGYFSNTSSESVLFIDPKYHQVFNSLSAATNGKPEEVRQVAFELMSAYIEKKEESELDFDFDKDELYALLKNKPPVYSEFRKHMSDLCDQWIAKIMAIINMSAE